MSQGEARIFRLGYSIEWRGLCWVPCCFWCS